MSPYWNVKDGVLYLSRSPAQENAELAHERSEHAAMFANWLKENEVKEEFTPEVARRLAEDILRLIPQDPSAGFDNWDQLQKLEKNSPIGRYFYRLLSEIGAQALSDVGDFGYMEYVEKPNAMQRVLPKGEAFRLFEREKAIYEDALDVATKEELNNSSYTSLRTESSVVIEKVSESLSVRMTDAGTSVNLQIGPTQYYSGAVNIGSQGTSGIDPRLLGIQRDYKPTPHEAELGSSLAKVFYEQSFEGFHLSDEARSNLSDPLMAEPLSLTGSNWIFESAKEVNKNVFAVLSEDAFVLSLTAISAKQFSLREYWTMFGQMGGGYLAQIDDEWLTVTPRRPMETRKNRIDRVKWRNLIKAHVPGEAFPLDEVAEYPALSDSESGWMYAAFNVILLNKDLSLIENYNGASVDVLRLYGRLGVEQKHMARNGGFEIPLENLPRPLVRPVFDIIFYMNASISRSRGDVSWARHDPGRRVGDEFNPTFALRGGIPERSKIRVSVLKNKLIYRPYERRPGKEGGGLDDIASRIVSEDYNPGSPQRYKSLFALGEAEQIIVEVELPGVGYLTSRAIVDLLPSDAKFVPLDDLPIEVRDALKSKIAAMRDLNKRHREGGGLP